MDIRFLQTYTPNVGYLFPRNFVTFSSTPSKNIVSPGIGQIFKSPSVFIPIYGLKSTHLIEKVVQNGGSNSDLEINSSDNLQSKTSVENSEKANNHFEIESDRKRKKMPDAIKNSFQNPVIKTATLNLSKKRKLPNSSFKFTVVD